MPVEIILPKFGFTLETADIVQWLKQEGDKVRSGDPICEVTTDKVNMEVEAPEEGTLYKLLFPQGATVPVTQVIAVLLRPGETPPAVVSSAAPVAASMAVPATEPASAKVPVATPLARRVAEAENIPLDQLVGTGKNNRITRRDVEAKLAPSDDIDATDTGKIRATPAARAAAEAHGVDLRLVTGTGPRGRIQRDDVTNYSAKAKAVHEITHTAASSAYAAETIPTAPITPLSSSEGDRDVIKMAGMRLTIATRLQKSFQTAPHIFFDAQIDTGAIDAIRERLKKNNQKVSVTSVIVKAVAWTLLKHPYLNATLDGDEISLWKTANMGVAVALKDGLVVPVIHSAEKSGLIEIQGRLDTLVDRAQNGGLRMNDMSGGTFTVSNLGMYGVDRFTAIINPPQVAILAVGRTQEVFVPDENGQPTLKSLMQVTLSADHRVVDGAQAALFMRDLRAALEDPTMLLW